MVAKRLLDTTAVSDIMRLEPAALERISAEKPRDVLLSSPVAAEIAFGLERLDAGSRRRELLEREYAHLRSVVSWVDWSERAALLFGRGKARLQPVDTPIDDMDLVIASIALATGARLATSNMQHFDRVDGLLVESWRR